MPIDPADVARLGAEITTDANARDVILEEVRRHLEEAAAALSAGRENPAAAAAQAIAAFGPPQCFAVRLNAVHSTDCNGRRMLLGLVWCPAVV